MGTPRRHHLTAWIVLVIVFTTTTTTRAREQEITTRVLKAAFLYNFAKFAEWPDTSSGAGGQLSLCVMGDGGVAEALEQTIKANTSDGLRLVVTTLSPAASIAGCNLLYVSGIDARRQGALLASVRNEPVMTVSDGSSFAKAGGIAQLILDRNRVRFAINTSAAERAGIRLSSKLLRLAELVEDDPHARD